MKISIDRSSFKIDRAQLALCITILLGVVNELVHSKLLPDEWTIRLLLLTNILSMILKPLVSRTGGSTTVETVETENVAGLDSGMGSGTGVVAMKITTTGGESGVSHKTVVVAPVSTLPPEEGP